MGISIDVLKPYCVLNNLTIVNEKLFYNRWTDTINFKCNLCNEYVLSVKSLAHFEKNNINSPFICPSCNIKKLGLVKEETFNNIVDKVEYYPNKIKLLPSTDLLTISPGLRLKISSQAKWNLISYVNTKQKAKFQCVDCGYIRENLPYNIFLGGGFGCVNCENIRKKQGVYSKLKDLCKISNCYPINPESCYTSINDEIDFKCNACGNIFKKLWGRMSNEDSIKCPECFKSIKRKSENEVYTFIKELYSGDIIQNDRTLIEPYELDIYIPEKKIAFEYCGCIWHSSKYNKDSNKHKIKYEMCLQKGIKLITIFEDEWTNKNEICKSRITNILGIITNRIFARKCNINEIDNKVALNFCEKNHIQGKGHVKESFGLFYNNELISVMTFSKPSVAKNGSKYDWELNRFCSKLNTVTVGGASKLLSAFKKKHIGDKLITFCDIRWGNGDVYENIGFLYDYTTRPNYYYIGQHTNWIRKHRFLFAKHVLMKKFNETDKELTEEQIAEKNGLYRIYDCGHKKYSMII
jgi:DNA-directed RNA polymerase subunit RPC12/RpoP